MTRHIVTYEEISDYLDKDGWSTVASSGSVDGSHKKLEASAKGMFRVTDQKNVTYDGPSLGLAVDAYNDAP